MRQIFPPHDTLNTLDAPSTKNKEAQDKEAVPFQLYEIEKAKSAENHFKKTGRSRVVVNMISSLDGSAVSGEGLSGGLGSKGDKAIFKSLRSAADFILVAANTVREEKYNAPKTSSETKKRRTERNQKASPKLVIISASLSFGEAAAFLDEGNPPIIYTTQNSPADKRAELENKTEIRFGGEKSVDLNQVIEDLSKEGKMILVEGGPSLNGALFKLNLIDELCLTLSPQIVGGDGTRIIRAGAAGKSGTDKPDKSEKPGLEFLQDLELSRVLCDDESFLYLQLIKK